MTTRFDDGPEFESDDPLAVILRPSSDTLGPPAGRYEAIRRAAARRRLLRTASRVGVACVVAALVVVPLRLAASGSPTSPTAPLAPPPVRSSSTPPPEAPTTAPDPVAPSDETTAERSVEPPSEREAPDATPSSVHPTGNPLTERPGSARPSTLPVPQGPGRE
ncbi:hypothetical protein [Streptomyces sp. 35G-GA-8]|uniref:hypothetical protein n=1 Tax=Streptomyces sp. 35G-GA-8 TaxID=2939434 RepID=UPI00201F95F3|nr:hypothetical protein [Streptomyces sp. 35G-GA-8]MCL7377260.1 hypothetical protein [Streptomyces sp. 35G-GA-8]